MSTGGDVSEQIVRDGMIVLEELAKITGSLSKEAVALLAALIRREGQTKGPTPVTNLKNHALKTGQQLEIFQLKKADIPLFKKLAKEYGLLYRRKMVPPIFLTKDGETVVDMVGLSGDAPGINHILEKLGYPVLERDTGKNAEARAASEPSSNERGNGYERSRQSRESDGPLPAGDTPGQGKSVLDNIRHFKQKAKEMRGSTAPVVSKTHSGPVR